MFIVINCFLCTMFVPSSTNLCIDTKDCFQHDDYHWNEDYCRLHSCKCLIACLQRLENSVTPWPCILAVADHYCGGDSSWRWFFPLNFDSSWSWWPRPCSTTTNWRIISMVHSYAKCTKIFWKSNFQCPLFLCASRKK